MSMPSNNKIEDRALGALRNIIDDHATMGHEFHSMDKEMSWDGSIWIYKDVNGTQDKRNYDDKVPVQIKGHVYKNRKYIDEQKITYSVDLDDLEAYFQDRGVLFFEIFMSEDGKDREIFYVSLFPTKLKVLIISKKSIDIMQKTGYNNFCSQEWRNWQTRTVQVRVVAIP